MPDVHVAHPDLWFWLIAGPNGSGKSTLEQKGLLEDLNGAPFLRFNADELTIQLRCEDTSLSVGDANLLAARIIDEKVSMLCKNDQSFVCETVLSSDKYKPIVQKWKERKNKFGLIFVALKSPEHSIERVKFRVEKGGHDVESTKIRDRWHKSLNNLPWFLKEAHKALIFDNSQPAGLGEPTLLYQKSEEHGIVAVSAGVHPSIDQRLAMSI